MSKIKMKAVDQLHISEIGPHTIQPGETFLVDAVSARSLEARGLATRIESKARRPSATKVEPPLENK
jgi:hypothetical protein